MAHRPLGSSWLTLGRALAIAWLQRWQGSGAGLSAWLTARLLDERERWFLWLPVGLGTGVALYFAMPVEPPVWLGPGLLLPLVFLLGQYRRRMQAGEMSAQLALVIGLSTLALGLCIAQWRTQLVAAPVLEQRGAYMVEGRVLLVEDRVRGRRVLLGGPAVEGLERAATPTTLRVSVRSMEPFVEPGDRVRLRAMLMPPSPPSEPHGFDFARHAYFMRLGAVGYGLGAMERVAPGERSAWRLELARLRQSVAHEISGAIPDPARAIAVALLTGLRGAIPDRVWQEWQIAGIAHLLAISGLHLGLVAGTLFFAVRIGLALCPPLALRVPGKKVAALVALGGALGYLLLTGMTVPTQRAFIMTALMLVAVMADRNPFSMRLVAWAALVVLLLQPESLLGASFQMSFAAVIALIATYETGVARRPDHASGLDVRLALYVGGVALTTVVASAATTPLAIYHFGRLPTYGIAANLIAVPLTAFWVMPLGLLGLILLPFGLAGVCFHLMGRGIELMLSVAATVAEWPGAAVLVPRAPTAALIAAALGGLWLCLWRGSWRGLGGLGIALALLLMLLAEPPDVLVDARGQIVAVRHADGRLALSPWERDGWVTGGWLRGAGQAEATPWAEPGGPGTDSLRCDALGCIVDRNGWRVALARKPEALAEDCTRTDLVISYPRIERCPNGTPLIGPRALRRAGGLALWLTPDRIEQLTVREVRGDRPWTRSGF